MNFDLEDGMQRAHDMLEEVRENRRRLFVIGNGGSAAVASHIVNDFVNTSRIKASVVSDPALLTCMANDYGYDHAYARIIATQANKGDLLIGISSSGQSANIRNAAAAMTAAGGRVITLSGFKADNPLSSLGEINMWLDSNDYGFVEVGHLFLLHHLADWLKAEANGS